MKSSKQSSKTAKHKPASDTRSRIDALRDELRGLLRSSERAGQTVRRIDEIMGEIHDIQGEER